MHEAARVHENEFFFKHALKVHPSYGAAYINYGVFMSQQQREAEACALWNGAIKTYDSWPSKVYGDLHPLATNFERCSQMLGHTDDVTWVHNAYPGFFGK